VKTTSVAGNLHNIRYCDLCNAWNVTVTECVFCLSGLHTLLPVSTLAAGGSALLVGSHGACNRRGDRRGGGGVIDVGERGIQLTSLAKGDAACVHRRVCTSRVQACVSLVLRGDESFFKQFAL